MASVGVTAGVERKKSTSYSAESPSAADILVDEESSEHAAEDESKSKQPVARAGDVDDEVPLTSKQRKRLGQILRREYLVHGRDGVVLRCMAADMIKAMSRLLHESGVVVRNMQIVGGVATYTACDRSDIPYNDLDIRVTLDCAPEARDTKFYKLTLPQIVVQAVCHASRRSEVEPGPMHNFVETNYYHAPTENDGDDDEWSIIKLKNDIGQNLELKFITRLRREFVFPQDSFQITLPSLAEKQAMDITDILLNARIRSAWNYDRAKSLSDKKLIRFVSPECVRGGGILRYCDMRSQGYKPHPDYSETEILRLIRQMVVRFCIDYPTKQLQQDQLERYLHNHFREGGVRSRDTCQFLDQLQGLCAHQEIRKYPAFNLAETIEHLMVKRACPIPKLAWNRNVHHPQAWMHQLPPLPQVQMQPGVVPMMPGLMYPLPLVPGVPAPLLYTPEQVQQAINANHHGAMLQTVGMMQHGVAFYSAPPPATMLHSRQADPSTASYNPGSPARRQSKRSRAQDVRKHGSDEEVGHTLQEVPRAIAAYGLKAKSVAHVLQSLREEGRLKAKAASQPQRSLPEQGRLGMPAYQHDRPSRHGRRSGSPGDEMGAALRRTRSHVMEMLGRPNGRIHSLVESLTYESHSSNHTSSRGSTASPELVGHPARQQRLPNRPSQQRSTRSKKKKWRNRPQGNADQHRRQNPDAPRQPNSPYKGRNGKNRKKHYQSRGEGYNGNNGAPAEKHQRKPYRKGRSDRGNGPESVNWRRRDDEEVLRTPHPRAQRRDYDQYGRGDDSRRFKRGK